MRILSNGYQLPETGDFGSTWFPAIENNIQRINDHNHDGTNSPSLSAASVNGEVVLVPSGDFSLVNPGEYRALVSLPSGMDIDTANMQIRDVTTKEPIYLRVEKFSITQVYVFTNFVANFEALFTS